MRGKVARPDPFGQTGARSRPGVCRLSIRLNNTRTVSFTARSHAHININTGRARTMNVLIDVYVVYQLANRRSVGNALFISSCPSGKIPLDQHARNITRVSKTHTSLCPENLPSARNIAQHLRQLWKRQPRSGNSIRSNRPSY